MVEQEPVDLPREILVGRAPRFGARDGVDRAAGALDAAASAAKVAVIRARTELPDARLRPGRC